MGNKENRTWVEPVKSQQFHYMIQFLILSHICLSKFQDDLFGRWYRCVQLTRSRERHSKFTLKWGMNFLSTVRKINALTSRPDLIEFWILFWDKHSLERKFLYKWGMSGYLFSYTNLQNFCGHTEKKQEWFSE